MNYINNATKVIIICPIHGEFEQRPGTHLRGAGCPKCKFDKLRKIRKKDTEQFIIEAKLVHGDRYNYDKTIYTGCQNSIIVTCPKHGDYEINAYRHLIDGNCPYCSGKHNLETFIEKANKVHNNYYSYNNSTYISSKDLIKITCPVHGDFEQVASDHLRGAGCPKCYRSHGETKIAKLLSEKNVIYKEQHKVHSNNRIYKIDFYIEYNNKKYAIEYNGIQHYEPVDYFGGEEKFISQQQRDFELKIYCQNNNIKLFEIKYDSNIEDELTNIINEITAVSTSDCEDNDSAKTVETEMLIPC